MLERGYNGTTVDEICSAAGTTKGAFFHHFKTKDDLGLATLDRYAERIFAVMREGADRRPHDPLGRVFDYVETLGDLSHETDRKPACLLAIETLELGAVHPEFRARCEGHFETWARYLEDLLEDAIASASRPVPVTARELADHLISVFEGALLLARAQADAAVIGRSLAHYQSYLRMILGVATGEHVS